MKTLSVELKRRLGTLNNGTEHRMKVWLRTSKQMICSGSERQTKQNMAPNVRMNDVMALNAKREYDFERQTEE